MYVWRVPITDVLSQANLCSAERHNVLVSHCWKPKHACFSNRNTVKNTACQQCCYAAAEAATSTWNILAIILIHHPSVVNSSWLQNPLFTQAYWHHDNFQDCTHFTYLLTIQITYSHFSNHYPRLLENLHENVTSRPQMVSSVRCRRFWLRSAIRRHHPPQRAVLSQICCFGERKVVLFQILLDSAEPRDAGTTWLSSPVCRRGG